jgi:hypothetical protein
VATLTNPNARHLVHEDEAPLEAVVHLVIARVSDASALDLLPPHLGAEQIKNKPINNFLSVVILTRVTDPH